MGFDYRTSTGLRKQTLEGTTKPWVHQEEERSRDPTIDSARLACECPGVSSGGMGWQWPATGSGHWLQQSGELWHAGLSPFEGGCHYRHYPYHSLTSGQTTGREHSPIHQQNIGLKIYWAWPCPPEQVFPPCPPEQVRYTTSVPHSQSLPSGSLYESLILIHQRTDRIKTTITEN